MADKKNEVLAEVTAIVEQAKAEAAALIETARAEAERIVAAAKGAPVGMTEAERAAYEAYMNEEVEVKLFRDNDKYKDPVFVGCNGETIAIQRGERVKIRRKFAEILDNSDRQDAQTGLLIRRRAAEFIGGEQ